MAYETYLFDLDGTLIDSVALILESFHHTRRVHFGDRLDDSHYLSTMGTPLRSVFEKMATEPVQVEDMMRTYIEFNLDRHDAAVCAYDGIAQAIQSLASRHVRLGVVTSKLRTTALRGLRVCGLHDYFQVVIAADDVRNGKPDPEPVFLALARLGAGADSAVLIGDSPHDLIAGRRAGVSTAAAAWGPFDADLLRHEAPTHWLDTPARIATLP